MFRNFVAAVVLPVLLKFFYSRENRVRVRVTSLGLFSLHEPLSAETDRPFTSRCTRSLREFGAAKFARTNLEHPGKKSDRGL
jgi:hypothetical protein